jgi:C-terminal processing protease CtpA/Prc
VDVTLSKPQREEILNKVDRIVRTKYFDPNFNGRDWPALVRQHRDRILDAYTPELFELHVVGLLKELGTSQTGFFRRESKIASRNSINATFRRCDTAEGPRWMFQDVQPGGPAARAGIKPAEILLTINEREIGPPSQPDFRMDASTKVKVLQHNGVRRVLNLELQTPRAKYPERPYAEPQSVSSQTLPSGIGVLRVAMFPGMIGVDFAREVDTAVRQVHDCERLIIDLRGNPGGGIGGLRLMGYLTPGKLPVGYSLTRKRAERGYRKEELPQFRGIPKYKWMLPLLLLRFAGRDHSIVVVTEGLGRQKFHRRVVVLVNEHTAGAGEMVARFAKENRLGTIVGARTAGRLLGGRGFKVGAGYIAVLPVGCYLTWEGERSEGSGVVPDVEVDWSAEDAIEGIDNQLNKAVEVVRSL